MFRLWRVMPHSTTLALTWLVLTIIFWLLALRWGFLVISGEEY